MKDYKSINKQVQKKDGTWAVETVRVPLTPEEIVMNEIKFKKKELKKCKDILDSTDWLSLKQLDESLTKEQMIERHPKQMTARIEARIKIQVLQSELS